MRRRPRLHHRRLDFQIPARVEGAIEAITRLRLEDPAHVGLTIDQCVAVRISMSVSPCHSPAAAAGTSRKSAEADRESLVFVRNRRPSTPTQSPKSVKSWLRAAARHSGYAPDPRASERRKFAPNDRMARMRPLVLVSAIGFELVVRALAVLLDQLRNRVAPVEPARIDLHPELGELLEVRSALLYLFFLGRHN